MIPFAAWSVIVLLWKVATNQFALEGVGGRALVTILLNNKMENVYWFFPLLFSFYLMMPVFSWLTQPQHRTTLKYVVWLMFVLQSTVMPLCSLVGIGWNGNLVLPLASYFIFIPLGYLLATSDLSRRQRTFLYICGALGAVIRYAGIYIRSMQAGEKDPLFFNYAGFYSVWLAVAVFVWVKSVNWERVLQKIHLSPELVGKIASCSLGVYLIHRIVMYYEGKLVGPLGFGDPHVLWRTLGIPVTYLAALALVALMKKIPVLQRLVP